MSPKKSENDPLDEVVERLVGLIARVRKRQAAVTQVHGVTMLQFTAIQALRQAGDINITQLAKRLHLNQSTVSSLIDRMERDGLVRRVQSSSDRRSVKLRLTDKADDIGQALPDSPLVFFRHLLDALTPEEQASLGKILVKIESRFETELSRIDSLFPLASKKREAG